MTKVSAMIRIYDRTECPEFLILPMDAPATASEPVTFQYVGPSQKFDTENAWLRSKTDRLRAKIQAEREKTHKLRDAKRRYKELTHVNQREVNRLREVRSLAIHRIHIAAESLATTLLLLKIIVVLCSLCLIYIALALGMSGISPGAIPLPGLLHEAIPLFLVVDAVSLLIYWVLYDVCQNLARPVD